MNKIIFNILIILFNLLKYILIFSIHKTLKIFLKFLATQFQIIIENHMSMFPCEIKLQDSSNLARTRINIYFVHVLIGIVTQLDP